VDVQCDKLATVVGRQFITLSVHICVQHYWVYAMTVVSLSLRQLRLLIFGEQVSAAADRPERRGTSRPQCCTQMWTVASIESRGKKNRNFNDFYLVSNVRYNYEAITTKNIVQRCSLNPWHDNQKVLRYHRESSRVNPVRIRITCKNRLRRVAVIEFRGGSSHLVSPCSKNVRKSWRWPRISDRLRKLQEVSYFLNKNLFL